MCPSTRDAAQGLAQDCFSSEDPILSEDPSPRAADAKAARNVDNLGRRRRGGRKGISAHVGAKNNDPPHVGQKQKPELNGASRDVNDEQANGHLAEEHCGGRMRVWVHAWRYCLASNT